MSRNQLEKDKAQTAKLREELFEMEQLAKRTLGASYQYIIDNSQVIQNNEASTKNKTNKQQTFSKDNIELELIELESQIQVNKKPASQPQPELKDQDNPRKSARPIMTKMDSSIVNRVPKILK
ncbi:Hypothetical_protein [Hexamita inflata]|uniref:Hypothetical_protein n=1 Tax=Hexamita inflata TaxID=28002 RepID=A0AA86Q6E2_9EUKA|nr:Hypothetical protein HINF_LOCUS40805 [Hexamita inflata]